MDRILLFIVCLFLAACNSGGTNGTAGSDSDIGMKDDTSADSDVGSPVKRYDDGEPQEVVSSGSHLFVAASEDGVLIFPADTRQIADPAAVIDVPAYTLALSGNILVVGRKAGLTTFDISQPLAPQKVDTVDLPSYLRMLHVHESRLHAVTGKESKAVSLHVSELKKDGTLESRGTFPHDMHLLLFRSRKDRLYRAVASAANGFSLWTYDISNPEEPVETGHFAPSGSAYQSFAPVWISVYEEVVFMQLVEQTVEARTPEVKALIIDLRGDDGPRVVTENDGPAPVIIEHDDETVVFRYLQPDLRSFYDSYYLSVEVSGCRTVNMAAPTNPETLKIFGGRDVAIVGDIALTVHPYDGLRLYDTSLDDESPVAHRNLLGSARDIDFSGDTTIVRTLSGDLFTVENAGGDGSIHTQSGSIDPDEYVFTTHETLLFFCRAAARDGKCQLIVRDITEEKSFRSATIYASDQFFSDLFTDGERVVLLTEENRVVIADILSDTTVSYDSDLIPARGVPAVHGSYIAVAEEDSLRLFCVTQPEQITETATIPLDRSVDIVAMTDDTIVLTDKTGLTAVKYSAASLVSAGTVEWPEPAAEIYNISVRKNRILVSAGKDGLFVVDISDPDTPELLPVIITGGTVMDAGYHDGLIFIADGEGGLLVMTPEHAFDQ